MLANDEHSAAATLAERSARAALGTNLADDSLSALVAAGASPSAAAPGASPSAFAAATETAAAAPASCHNDLLLWRLADYQPWLAAQLAHPDPDVGKAALARDPEAKELMPQADPPAGWSHYREP